METVIERGAHSKVIETSRAVLDKNGQLTLRKGRYTVLQTGMNRLVNGEYIESRAVVESYPSGAIANQASHQAIFSKNLLAEGGTVDLLSSDGKRLRAVPVGLGWKNAKTGQFAWIARAKDTAGTIQPPNVVVYENAFDSIRANVVVSYTTAGLEAWVVLKENPTLPAGFAPESTLFQVITEFLEVPAAVSEKVIARHTPEAALTENWVEPELTDVFTDWGAMQLWPGRAFPLTPSGEKANSSEARVFKQWDRANGRTLLFESLPYPSIRSELEQLPRQTAQTKPVVRDRFEWAALPVSAEPKGAMKVASAKSEGPGFAVDWTVVTSQSSYTFLNGITYKIQSTVYLSQSAQIQSGAILKFTTVDYGGANGYLAVMGSITTPYELQPCAILTHVEDNSAGEPLGGNHLTQKYPYGLHLSSLTYYAPLVQRLEIRYANIGLCGYYTGNNLSVWDCVFKNCNTGIEAAYSTIYIHRTFMCDVVTPWVETGGSIPSPEFTQVCSSESAPSITSILPLTQTRQVGENVLLTVTATGFALNYQWFHNNRSIAGATGYFYAIQNVQFNQAGQYYVEVENEAGMKRSTNVTLEVEGIPQITVPPADQTVPEDSKVTFSVEAIGAPPFNGNPNTPFFYTWYGPHGLFTAGTSHELVIPEVKQLDHEGAWFVTVKNGKPETVQSDFWLTVQPLADRTYTYNGDFDEGVLINLNHNVANQLQINSDPTPLPYINVPCSGSSASELEPPYGRGTLARINVNSGEIVGEYFTAPVRYGGSPPKRLNPNPSRTAVDRFGNLWVANRTDDMFFDDEKVYKGSIAKIGMVIGGIRCTRSGAAAPYTFIARRDGEYLRPPFVYNTCRDKDGDGAIRTSRGLRHVLNWSTANPDEPEDEAILKYVRVDCPGTRALAVDTNNNVWVGGTASPRTHMHQNIHGETGAILWTSNPALQSGGYVGVINDVAGVRWLWSTYPSAQGGAGHPTWVRLKLSDKTCYPNTSDESLMGDYGAAVDPKHHDVWISKCPGFSLAKCTSNGSLAQPIQGRSPRQVHQGLVVDNHDNVWVAHGKRTDVDAANTVGHLLTNGTWVGNVNLSSTHANLPGPTGVSIDSNQKVWVANFDSNNVMRINPNAGPYSGEFNQWRVGQVDLIVNLNLAEDDLDPYKKAHPYAMSDMTGFVNLAATYPSGVWIFVQDGGLENRTWHKLSWNFNTPTGTGITAEVRAANTIAGLPGSQTSLNSFRNATNNVAFNPAVSGRHLEVRVTLWRIPTTSNRPLLYDLTVHPTD